MPSDRRAPDVDGALSLCFGAFAMPFRPPSVSLLRIRGSSACSSGKRRPVLTLRSCNRSLRRWSIEIPFTLNDPPYRTERCYNALRLASELVKTDPATEVAVFLMANAVSCGKKGRKTPDGDYNLERVLQGFATGAHRNLRAAAAWMPAG